MPRAALLWPQQLRFPGCETGLTLGQFALSLAAVALFVAVAYYAGSFMGEGFTQLIDDLR